MDHRKPNRMANPGAIVVDVQAITKTYREGNSDRRILSTVDFVASAGEFVAIGGPSGSGKSTFLNLLSGLDRPDQGTISVAGREVTSLAYDECTRHRRKHIGLVFQFFNLIPTLTVAENLRLPLMLNRMEEPAGHIDALLAEFGLYSRRQAYPNTLSGGEQQRLAVLRAAVHDPPVILADEPTGNLDRERGTAVTELLRTLAQRGTCVIMVTHSRQASHAASRRLQLVDGELDAWDW